MNALTDRPRARRFIEAGARRALALVEAAQPPPVPGVTSPIAEQPPPGAPARFARDVRPTTPAGEDGGASAVLYERLDADDLASIERRIDEEGMGDHLAAAAAQSPAARRHVMLAFGVWLGVDSVLEKTGLPRVQPPDDVHAMARGPYSAAGGLYEADLVVDALSGVGVDVAQIESGLDFGCSSGRVLRVLANAYSQTAWRGCDPNEAAIHWARGHLVGSEFFVNDDAPPLPLSEGSLDLAYAISIWSHFAPELGLRWFDEMHRVVRPGGHLVATTHGLTSIAFYVIGGLRSPQQSDEIAGSLYRQGWWYAAEFGDAGDWGVVSPSWGTAFVSPEWLLSKLCPRWRVLDFAPGRNQDNQDVYVLQRA